MPLQVATANAKAAKAGQATMDIPDILGAKVGQLYAIGENANLEHGVIQKPVSLIALD